MRDTIEMAREAGLLTWLKPPEDVIERFKAFEALVRADEREAIKDEWWMCVQSDLENGVKSLNEQAAAKWRKEYPEITKFGAWLNERGEIK
jgi:hypothetical protein